MNSGSRQFLKIMLEVLVGCLSKFIGFDLACF